MTRTKKMTKTEARIQAQVIAIGLIQASISNGEVFEDDPPEVIIAARELLLKMKNKLASMRAKKNKVRKP